MPDACGDLLDAKARTVAGHRLCEFCAVIAEEEMMAFEYGTFMIWRDVQDPNTYHLGSREHDRIGHWLCVFCDGLGYVMSSITGPKTILPPRLYRSNFQR